MIQKLCKGKRTLKKAITSGIISIGLILSNTVFASDVTIESYVEGGLTFTLSGDWLNGISTNNTTLGDPDTQAYWTSVPNTDYISFVDDTIVPGFHIQISFSDLVYSGGSPDQDDLTAGNIELFGEHNGTSSSSITKSYDDENYNLSILPDSCGTATTTDFTFHSDFKSSQEDYALTGSNSTVTLIESDVDCLVMGHIRFDRVEILVPELSRKGSYTSTITLTAVDGPSIL